jgi:multicomponent Na+:H+ antiporter subunit B
MALLGGGLLIAFISGVPALAGGQPFMTSQWLMNPIALGTPVLFDIGVFGVVTGVVLMMIFYLAEEA